MRRYVPALVAAICAVSANAEPHFNLAFGTRNETDSAERLPAASFAMDFGSDKLSIRPEAGLSIGFDPLYGGNETELSAGILGYWEPGENRFHLGIGLSNVSSDWGANSGSSTGLYVHGGIAWRPRSRWLGIDVRYLDAGDFESYGTPISVGYLQFALMFGW